MYDYNRNGERKKYILWYTCTKRVSKLLLLLLWTLGHVFPASIGTRGRSRYVLATYTFRGHWLPLSLLFTRVFFSVRGKTGKTRLSSSTVAAAAAASTPAKAAIRVVVPAASKQKVQVLFLYYILCIPSYLLLRIYVQSLQKLLYTALSLSLKLYNWLLWQTRYPRCPVLYMKAKAELASLFSQRLMPSYYI